MYKKIKKQHKKYEFTMSAIPKTFRHKLTPDGLTIR